MQKKIIALAVAAALTAPALAFADNANVTIYGKAFVNVERVSNDMANVNPATGLVANNNLKNAMRVNNDASRLGVKGSEDLGGGLNGLYQFEVQMDAAGTNGLASSRNSGVGMEAGFGKVMLGIWDTPFKVTRNAMELFDNTTSFTALNVMGRVNSAASTAGVAVANSNYNTRQSNMMQYWTPKMGGLQGAISYSPDSAPGNTAAAGGGLTAGQGNKSRLSMSGTFEQDAIYAALGYERRPDATIVGQTDSGLRMVGKFTAGDAWVGLTLERLTSNALVAAVPTSYTQSNVELAAQYKMGSDKFAASFAKAGSTNVASTGAKQFSLRYGHDFSKRTELFVAYTSLKNDIAGNYSVGTMLGSSALGSKQSVLGTGMIVSF